MENPVSIAVGLHPSRSFPYLIAFGGEDGTVKIWSILSNGKLAENELAETFVIYDLRERSEEITSTGKLLVLPPPRDMQRADSNDGDGDATTSV